MERKADVSLGRAAWLFLRVSNLTFGGGDPIMAALEREMVSRRKWLEPGQYALAYSLARITPGTNMIAFCVAAGWYLRKWAGAVAAAVAVSAPSAVLVVWLTWAYQGLKSNALAMAAISGTLAAAAGMMLAAAWQLARPLAGRNWIRGIVLAGGSALLLAVFDVSPIAVLALAAAAGAYWIPKP